MGKVELGKKEEDVISEMKEDESDSLSQVLLRTRKSIKHAKM